MTRFPRFALLAGALVSSLLSFLLLLDAGLPQRADFTGEIVNQQRFAPETGALAPLFEQSTLASTPISLVELRGTPVILNFWATWCVPCRVEMPVLQSLHDRYAEQGLHIIGINLGESETVIHRWVDDLALTFDIVADHSGEITARYYLLGQPSTYVIAPNGRIVGIFHGPVSEQRLYALISPYL